jgi:DhnA family fructose-bisphosphate aldolase class Ia
MPEQASPLAAMISAVADGQLLTRQDKDRMRLLMVDEALERGLTWNMIAVACGYPSGKQAKKIIHSLRERVQQAERLGSRS